MNLQAVLVLACLGISIWLSGCQPKFKDCISQSGSSCISESSQTNHPPKNDSNNDQNSDSTIDNGKKEQSRHISEQNFGWNQFLSIDLRTLDKFDIETKQFSPGEEFTLILEINRLTSDKIAIDIQSISLMLKTILKEIDLPVLLQDPELQELQLEDDQTYQIHLSSVIPDNVSQQQVSMKLVGSGLIKSSMESNSEVKPGQALEWSISQTLDIL